MATSMTNDIGRVILSDTLVVEDVWKASSSNTYDKATHGFDDTSAAFIALGQVRHTGGGRICSTTDSHCGDPVLVTKSVNCVDTADQLGGYSWRDLQGAPAALPEPNYPNSEAEWEARKENIRTLYMQQNRTLKDVIERMKRERRFKASVKIYKIRIARWGFDKKLKMLKVVAVLRKEKERGEISKTSRFVIKDRIVDFDNIERYLQRKGMSVKDAIATATSKSSALRCHTPEAVPRSPSITGSSKDPAFPFRFIRDYVTGSVDGGLWSDTDCFVPLIGGGLIWRLRYSALELYDDFNSAMRLLNQAKRFRNSESVPHWKIMDYGSRKLPGRPGVQVERSDLKAQIAVTQANRRAGKLLVRGSARLEEVLRRNDPFMLSNFLGLLLHIGEFGYHEISGLLLQQIKDMASRILPSMHPILQIFAVLQNRYTCDTYNSEEVARLWQCYLNTFGEATTGLARPQELVQRINYLRARNTMGDYNAGEQLRGLVNQHKVQWSKECSSNIAGILELAKISLDEGRPQEACHYATMVLTLNEKYYPLGIHVQFRERAMRILALAHHQSGHLDLAESVLRNLIQLTTLQYGQSGALVLREMIRLEDWLYEWGRSEEAAEISGLVEHILDETTIFI